MGQAGNSESKWECDPRNNENQCIFYFRGDPFGDDAQYKDFNFKVPCKCSLATINKGGDGLEGDPNQEPPNWVNNDEVPMGYCGSILGTNKYQ